MVLRELLADLVRGGGEWPQFDLTVSRLVTVRRLEDHWLYVIHNHNHNEVFIERPLQYWTAALNK